MRGGLTGFFHHLLFQLLCRVVVVMFLIQLYYDVMVEVSLTLVVVLVTLCVFSLSEIILNCQ